ncbi:b5fc1ca1-0684-45ae-ad6a-557b8c1e4b77 [Thermothielavioides terrestris]|uniref:B5fc1ca1-0684-45ae-ad6a-557b8c1e4b77 n=1 Tax=Thermothielavioides terrestris TaxID=2587410 RepID=A0A3S4EVI9_9PEZI|nr:b5fc1ca1-0684-45ae-ad6a-557b8c1e4b77 [Thermothielavioides terrestris]
MAAPTAAPTPIPAFAAVDRLGDPPAWGDAAKVGAMAAPSALEEVDAARLAVVVVVAGTDVDVDIDVDVPVVAAVAGERGLTTTYWDLVPSQVAHGWGSEGSRLNRPMPESQHPASLSQQKSVGFLVTLLQEIRSGPM